MKKNKILFDLGPNDLFIEKNDKGIDYIFNPGPFTSLLRDAYANPDDNYVLIIEEINNQFKNYLYL